MLKFRLKWQSNQAPKFLRGSMLGEMMDDGEMMDSPIVISFTLEIRLSLKFYLLHSQNHLGI